MNYSDEELTAINKAIKILEDVNLNHFALINVWNEKKRLVRKKELKEGKSIPLSEWLESDEFKEMVKNHKFESMPYYINISDTIHQYFEDKPTYAEWINHYLTLYRVMGDEDEPDRDKIIGFAFENITGLFHRVSKNDIEGE